MTRNHFTDQYGYRVIGVYEAADYLDFEQTEGKPPRLEYDYEDDGWFNGYDRYIVLNADHDLVHTAHDDELLAIQIAAFNEDAEYDLFRPEGTLKSTRDRLFAKHFPKDDAPAALDEQEVLEKGYF